MGQTTLAQAVIGLAANQLAGIDSPRPLRGAKPPARRSSFTSWMDIIAVSATRARLSFTTISLDGFWRSPDSSLNVNSGGMLGHWGGVKLYHLVCSCPAKKSELTGQHKCPRQWLRGMPCLRAGQQTAGRKVLVLPTLRQPRLKVGRQRSPCYA